MSALNEEFLLYCECLQVSHSLSFPLQGAGQDVGRSCILVSIGGKNIMLDCGMHMGYNDDVSGAVYSAEERKKLDDMEDVQTD